MYGIAGAMDAPGLAPHYKLPPKPGKMQDPRGAKSNRNRKFTRDQDKKYPDRIKRQEA